MAMKIYFDNAATTPIDPVVLAEMMPYLTDNFGNPSSIHEYGRKAKAAVEKSRKIVAKYLNASAAEVFFTSCGTESNNMVIKQAVANLGVKRIISSPTEHHCVLHTVKTEGSKGVAVDYVQVNAKGDVDVAHLETLLAAQPETKTLVSLMHANNEIGTLLNIQHVGEICAKYGALFHSDSVQTVAHYPMDVQATKVHFLSGSAHKFHGPKGIGFVYINGNNAIKPLIEGGAQERNMRAGTENVVGIVGLGKALELWMTEGEQYRNHIESIRDYMAEQLLAEIPSIVFNGYTDQRSLYHVLSVSVPANQKTELLLFNLDISGICASGASACASGSMQASHVLEAIKADENRRTVRFSFSKNNTKDEVDFAVAKLKEMV
jgi:cysteine desulfurase